MANKTLHLFTAQYPFGNKSETFLETEIKYLAEGFDKVIIYPSSKTRGLRPLPNNCEVNEVLCFAPLTKLQKLRILLCYLRQTLYVLNQERKDKGFSVVWHGRKTFLDLLTAQLKKYALLSKSTVFNLGDSYYDYWYVNSTLCLTFAKKKGEISGFYARAHGYDLYDERWEGVGVPFRISIHAAIKYILFISKMGMNYFYEKVDDPKRYKAKLAYLGVEEQELLNKTKETVNTLVSCSSLLDFKNVHKIPALLNSQNQPIHWFHFGDGPEEDALTKQARTLKSNIEFKYFGHVSNQELMNFYGRNAISGFISLSDIEGLPVSMMEALSFGIPILAKNVGGVSELITEETGLLIDKDDDPVNRLTSFLEKEWNKQAIQDFQRKHFDARSNYSRLVELLKEPN